MGTPNRLSCGFLVRRTFCTTYILINVMFSSLFCWLQKRELLQCGPEWKCLFAKQNSQGLEGNIQIFPSIGLLRIRGHAILFVSVNVSDSGPCKRVRDLGLHQIPHWNVVSQTSFETSLCAAVGLIRTSHGCDGKQICSSAQTCTLDCAPQYGDCWLETLADGFLTEQTH